MLVQRTFDSEEFARKLVGAAGFAAFEADVREQRYAKFEAAFAPEEAMKLFDVERLERGVANGAIALALIDIYSNDHIVRLGDLADKTGRSPIDVAAQHLREGATLRVRDIELADPGLAALRDAVQAQYEAKAQINLYLTPPQRQGFPPHFDTTDVLVVQIAGEKAWRLFESYAHEVKLPTSDTAWDPLRYTPNGEGEPVVLRQGDVLYIPRGGMHAAATVGETSMHLTISLAPTTFAELLVREINRIARDEMVLRRRAAAARDVDVEAKALLALVAAKLDARTALAVEARGVVPRASVGTLARALRGEEEGD